PQLAAALRRAARRIAPCLAGTPLRSPAQEKLGGPLMNSGLPHRWKTSAPPLLGFLTSSLGWPPGPPAGTRPPAPAGSAAGQVTIAEPTRPDTFDPIAHSDFNNWYVWQLAYETLVVVQPNGRVAPQLATSWKVSPDGLVYTFTFRPGVKFHN